MRDQLLYFNHLPCFLCVISAIPRVYPALTGDEIEDGVRGQGVSGHAAWRRATRLYRTNRRGNLY